MRNQWLFNEVATSEKEVVDRGMHEWMEYREAMMMKAEQQVGIAQGPRLCSTIQQWVSFKVGY